MNQENGGNGEESDPAAQVVQHKYKESFEVPDVYSFPFDKPGLERPWLENKEKSDEYFNYGFNEESFKEYQKKVISYSDANMKKIMED